MDTPEVKITLQPDGVVAPTIHSLKECSESVLFGLKSIDQITSLPDILTEEDTFFQQQFGQPESFETQKLKYKEWLILKGFEELIEGVKLSLVEAFRFVTIWEEWFGGKGKSTTLTLEKIQQDYDELKKTSSKQHLPGLLHKVKQHLTMPLKYEDCLISLNKARACLVHRKGVVSTEDTNSLDDTLTVKWIKYSVFYDSQNGRVELEKNQRTIENVAIKITTMEIEKKFKQGEKVSFTYTEFNQLLTTFHHFAMDLASKLPKEK